MAPMGAPRAAAVADSLGHSPSEEILLLLLAQSNWSHSPYKYFKFKFMGIATANGMHVTVHGALEKEMDCAIFLGDDVGDDDASPQWTAEEAECMIHVNHEDEMNGFFVCCWRHCNPLTADRPSTNVSFEESLLKQAAS